MINPDLLKELSNNPLFGDLMNVVSQYAPQLNVDCRPLAESIAKNYDGEIDINKLTDAISKTLPNTIKDK